jgi:hypothetical protein
MWCREQRETGLNSRVCVEEEENSGVVIPNIRRRVMDRKETDNHHTGKSFILPEWINRRRA